MAKEKSFWASIGFQCFCAAASKKTEKKKKKRNRRKSLTLSLPLKKHFRGAVFLILSECF
jgi:hypothetical protein